MLIVTADINEHPGTTVTEIAKRTGIVQSRVSNCVARLRGAGAVLAEPDPADGRRTILRPDPVPSARVSAISKAPVAEALAARISDPAEATALPERLAALFQTGPSATKSR
ncbi:MarR family transcriptional regulator [Actinomadura nitritigenes]|uniref:MarR family transcriptional regulator n=1 Tax=Actinomadura nitritigenes TaxID=134602 RepID=UPI003D8A08FF